MCIRDRLKLSPKKCSLFQKEVQYLGHLISAAGVSMDPNKLDTVRDWPVPKNKHGSSEFPGVMLILPTFCERLRYYC